MKSQDDKDLLVEVSVMYYLEGMTQSDIAKNLYMSRPKVSRLLQKAKKENIVDIRINYDTNEFFRIKRRMLQLFKVDNVIVVKTLKNQEATIREIGYAASNELKYQLTDNMTIGMSWGRTIKHTVDAFKPKTFKNIHVVELFGAVDYREDRPDMLSIGFNFSKKIGGTYFPLPAPVFIQNNDTYKAIVENPLIKNTIKAIDDCDLIMTGLGAINTKAPQKIWDSYVDFDAKNDIINAGGLGYICARFFDQDGQFINHKLNKNVIGIQTTKIKKNNLFIVAGGLYKWQAIHAFLKDGHVNTLVCDDKTLKKILNAQEQENRNE